MGWIFPLIIASALWASHFAFIRIAIEKLPAASLTLCFYIVGLLTAFVVLLTTRTKVDFELLIADKKLLGAVVFAGITIGLTDFFFSKGLSANPPPPVAIYGPLFTTIALSLIALIGILVFKESLTP